MLVPLTVSVWCFNTRFKKYIYIKEWRFELVKSPDVALCLIITYKPFKKTISIPVAVAFVIVN